MGVLKIADKPTLDEVNNKIVTKDEIEEIVGGSPTGSGRAFFTETAMWTVPSGINTIWITACAAGGAPLAGQFCIERAHKVNPGAKIWITVGAGNTYIEGLADNDLALVAASYNGAFENNKLGFMAGITGSDGVTGASGYYSGPYAAELGNGGAGGAGGCGGAFGYGGSGAGGGGGGGSASVDGQYSGVGGKGGNAGAENCPIEITWCFPDAYIPPQKGGLGNPPGLQQVDSDGPEGGAGGDAGSAIGFGAGGGAGGMDGLPGGNYGTRKGGAGGKGGEPGKGASGMVLIEW